jgi:hypothetical protein
MGQLLPKRSQKTTLLPQPTIEYIWPGRLNFYLPLCVCIASTKFMHSLFVDFHIKVVKPLPSGYMFLIMVANNFDNKTKLLPKRICARVRILPLLSIL